MMKVVQHKVVESINLTPGVHIAQSTRLGRKLQKIKTAINRELADRGLAIMDLGYGPGINEYHYTVPSSYAQEDYPFIKVTVEKYCNSQRVFDGEMGYCGNPHCTIIEQVKRACEDEKCPDQKLGEHAHCKKCGDLI